MADPLTIVKRFYNEVLADPVAACERYLAPGFVLENYLPEHLPFGGRYEGQAGMLEYLQELAAAIEMGPLDMHEWLCAGNSVVVRGEEGSQDHKKKEAIHWRNDSLFGVWDANRRITGIRLVVSGSGHMQA